jgi:hypothetical protein
LCVPIQRDVKRNPAMSGGSAVAPNGKRPSGGRGALTTVPNLTGLRIVAPNPDGCQAEARNIARFRLAPRLSGLSTCGTTPGDEKVIHVGADVPRHQTEDLAPGTSPSL